VHFIRLPGDVDHPARLHIRAEGLRRQTKGSKIRGRWGPNGIAVMGQIGCNLQLVDVIYPCGKAGTCGEEWKAEKGSLLSAVIMHAARAARTPRRIVRLSVSFRGK
jgi:hypothetical protein